jgi:hypothetical protein
MFGLYLSICGLVDIQIKSDFDIFFTAACRTKSA